MDDLDRHILRNIGKHILANTTLDDPQAAFKLEFAEAAINRANTQEDSMLGDNNSPVARPPHSDEPAEKVYSQLEVGDRFHSPRKDEGVVTVVCAPGKCEHDKSRDEYGCHVRGIYDGWPSEFFVNHIPSETVRLAAKPSWLR